MDTTASVRVFMNLKKHSAAAWSPDLQLKKTQSPL
jgi:hypothetical protein